MGTGAGSHVQNFIFKRGINRVYRSEVRNVAKDGTNRGGPRPGTGPKRKPLLDKIQEGTAKGTLVMPDELPEPAEIQGEDIPPVREYLTAKQKNGRDLCAEEIFKETWRWLKARGCEMLVNNQLIEQYAMSVARWIQCEEAISEYGYLAKHPHHRKPHRFPLCVHEPRLQETGQCGLVPDLSDFQRELLCGIRRPYSPGRSDGAAAPRKEQKIRKGDFDYEDI